MYTPTPSQSDQVQRAFTYHPPRTDQVERYERIRACAQHLAGTFITNCPQSRELSVALTKLQESVMWANAAIACNEAGDDAPGPNSPLSPPDPSLVSG
jgi:hypothetical protein